MLDDYAAGRTGHERERGRGSEREDEHGLRVSPARLAASAAPRTAQVTPRPRSKLEPMERMGMIHSGTTWIGSLAFAFPIILGLRLLIVLTVLSQLPHTLVARYLPPLSYPLPRGVSCRS